MTAMSSRFSASNPEPGVEDSGFLKWVGTGLVQLSGWVPWMIFGRRLAKEMLVIQGSLKLFQSAPFVVDEWMDEWRNNM